MKRVIVLGGLGRFGRTMIDQLNALAIATLSGSRGPGAALRIDAEDIDSIRGVCRPGDLVIDATGPFHMRSTRLIETGIEIGFDVIDINDDLSYAERVLALSERIDDAGIRVLSSASSVSAISASIVRLSQIRDPVRVSAFLAPASRHTANSGTARSLIHSVGRPVRILRAGTLQTLRGWSESKSLAMPAPVGLVTGHLFESADAAYLPRIWTSLRDVEMFVDTNSPGMNCLLKLVEASPFIRGLIESQVSLGTWITRRIGSPTGGIGYEIESIDSTIARYALVADRNSFVIAVAPAVLAAKAVVHDRFVGRGLIPPDRHVAATELFEFLSRSGINVVEVR